MNELKAALNTIFDSSAALDALATSGQFYGEAPPKTAPPYFVFQLVPAGAPEYTLKLEVKDDFIFILKGVAVATATKSGDQVAQEIADAAVALVVDQAITLSGTTRTVMSARKVG